MVLIHSPDGTNVYG